MDVQWVPNILAGGLGEWDLLPRGEWEHRDGSEYENVVSVSMHSYNVWMCCVVKLFAKHHCQAL